MKKIIILLLIQLLFVTAYTQKKSFKPTAPSGNKLPNDKIERYEVADSLLDNAFESMQIFARINTSDAELEVKVNGRIVGRYTQTVKVTLDGFLKRNTINVVSFKFSKESNANYVELSGKLPGSADWIAIFNFNSKPGKTEEQFEVPFIGKINKQPAGYNIKNGKAQNHEAAPVENGYESVKIFFRINNDEQMEVKVNGRIVGKYTQTVGVNLDAFLKRDAMNVISFNFSTGSKESSVELSGKFPGNGDFTPVYNFNPKAGKTEGKFEVPFTGKKK